MNKLNKLIDDTLRVKGKWSMKRLTAFITFKFVLVLGVFIVISDTFLQREINRYSLDVFNSLLLFLATLMGITEFGKKIVNKEIKTEEEING